MKYKFTLKTPVDKYRAVTGKEAMDLPHGTLLIYLNKYYYYVVNALDVKTILSLEQDLIPGNSKEGLEKDIFAVLPADLYTLQVSLVRE